MLFNIPYTYLYSNRVDMKLDSVCYSMEMSLVLNSRAPYSLLFCRNVLALRIALTTVYINYHMMPEIPHDT